MFLAVCPCIPTIKVCGTEGRTFESCRVRQQLKLPNITLIEEKISSALKCGIKSTVPFSYEEAVEKIKSSLKELGFGVLTEIDVKATLINKIDQDFTKYVTLGACNPGLAFQVLSEEINIGLLLPCNVVVFEDPEK